MMRGIFAVAKPVGITSAKVTNIIKAVLVKEALTTDPDAGKRRGSSKIKVGHGGTLDKGASGVLVIAVGEDCKRLSAFLGSDKYYECVGKLGEATDTLDMDGEVVQETAWKHVSASGLSEALRTKFTGKISQTPPVYSALKHKGKRSSDLARKGIVFAPAVREVTVYSARLMGFQPPYFTISVHCSSGTYIRSIVHDLGQSVGSAAHVSKLCRTKQGPFDLSQALSESEWTYSKICRLIEKNNDRF